jgi:hypothetical protein
MNNEDKPKPEIRIETHEHFVDGKSDGHNYKVISFVPGKEGIDPDTGKADELFATPEIEIWSLTVTQDEVKELGEKLKAVFKKEDYDF